MPPSDMGISLLGLTSLRCFGRRSFRHREFHGEPCSGSISPIRRFDSSPVGPYDGLRGEETISIVGTVATPELVSYAIRIQNSGGLWLADPAVTLAGDGLEKVVDDLIGTWDTTGLSADHYRIHLEVQLDTGDTIVESVQVAVDPALHEGWPITLGQFSFGIMTLTISAN